MKFWDIPEVSETARTAPPLCDTLPWRKQKSGPRSTRRLHLVRFDSLDPGDRRACSCAIAVVSDGGDGPLRTDGLARDGDRAAGGRRGGSGDDRAPAGVRVERRRLARQDA